jgi:hypothetical protein
MTGRLFVVVATLLVLANGCASVPLPGSAGEVSGPLGGIDFHTKRPQRGEYYPTAARERLFASDRQIYVLSRWTLPGPGEYVSKVVLRTPAGSVHREREYRFRAEASSWLTFQPFQLPEGEAARPLAGAWEVEVSLDAKPLGRRGFTFDPSSIRLRTDARLVIAQGKADFAGHPGEWRWRHQYAAVERTNAALGTLGVVLRDELLRRFPHVDGPRSSPEGSDTTVLLTPSLLVSPEIEGSSRLDLEMEHLSTKVVRNSHFTTRAGRERRTTEGILNFALEAADLAVKAASSPEVLEFLVSATQAVSE